MDFALSEEQRATQGMARRFAEGELAPYAAEWDEKKVFPVDVTRKTGEERMLRDVRVHQVLEGADEIMRVIVARDLLKECQA